MLAKNRAKLLLLNLLQYTIHISSNSGETPSSEQIGRILKYGWIMNLIDNTINSGKQSDQQSHQLPHCMNHQQRTLLVEFLLTTVLLQWRNTSVCTIFITLEVSLYGQDILN